MKHKNQLARRWIQGQAGLLILWVFLFLSAGCMNRTEDGFRLHYTVNAMPKNPGDQKQRYDSVFGTGMVMLLVNGNYLHKPDNGNIDMLLYNGDENAQFAQLENEDSLYFMDCSEENRRLDGIKSLENRVILGEDCHCYELQTMETVYTFCAPKNMDFKVDGFKGHKFGFFNKIMEQCRGPYYYLKMDYPTYSIEYEVTEVEKTKISMSEFNVPDKPLKQNAF